MKKIFFLIFILVSITSAQDLQKYFVYFKDKGGNQSNILNKSSQEYQTALNSLTQRSIDRRKYKHFK